MAYARPLLEAYPRELGVDVDVLSRCIEACYECSQACTACADADLGEEQVAELIRCIRLCEDCADVCVVAGRVASRQTERDANATRTVMQACVDTCRVCGDECERHAPHHVHCRICAEACRRCEAACQELVRAIA